MSTASASGTGGGLHSILPEIPIFELMPAEVRTLVVASLEPVSYSFGDVIVREGEEPDAFYVIVSGTARAVKRADNGDDVPLDTLGIGDSFGFVELIEQTPRAATVRASGPVQALRLDAAVFRGLLRSNPGIRSWFDVPVRLHHLRHFLRTDAAFGRLTTESLGILLAELEEESVSAGTFVFREGDPAGPAYVILEGRARAFVKSDSGREDRSFLRRGDVFGEVSLISGAPRSASVDAVGDLRLLALKPATFAKLIERDPGFRQRMEERVAGYAYKERARVPLDFSEELLPAMSGVHQAVSLDQVDYDEDEEAAGAAADQTVGEPAPADGPPAARRRRIRRFPHLFQIDEADCGAACVAMVCRHFGRAVSLPYIRQLVNTTTDGTSLAGIARGGEGVGLAGRTLNASKSRLDELALPAIVHYEGNHWIVLFDVQGKRVRVADPGTGVRWIDRAEFLEKWSGFAALLNPTPALAEAPEVRASFGWLKAIFRPHRATFARALGLALLAAGLQFLIPIFSQVIVDDVIAKNDTNLLTVVVFAMVGVIALLILTEIFQRFILSRAAVKMDGTSLDFVTSKLLALPMSYFNTRRTGDIERRLAGLRQVRQLLVQNGVQALTAVTQIVVALILMFVYSWVLGLVWLATVPFYVGLLRYSQKRLRPVFDTLEEAFGRYESRQIDAIKGIETVKALGAEPALRQLLVTQFNGLAKRVFKADYTIMVYEGLVQGVSLLSFALFLWIGALQVLNGSLTIGGLVSFNALVLLANAPVQLLLSQWDQLQISHVLLGRMNDIFEQEPEQGEDHSGLRAVTTLEGRIRLDGVGFRYGGAAAPPILEQITFDVPAGTTVAIVGRSGSGKTTLIKCLAGLLEPTEGSILYDELDMRTLDYRTLRRQVGFVLQESYLFDETIARNIAFGEDEPDSERVRWASRAANAHEFVERLPLGYETRVGESGLLVSGGQKQRIAIARALYHRPPVLLLDEATSSLDTESERAVKQNMDDLLRGRTSFVIAHRLSTIRDADVILVLERGKLVEHGSHDELMARQGLYYYLASQQLEL
ncbi:MAG: ATP-binding cassette, subfamily bacterial HlyB/CyaB [Thermoleophilaceae bacterium]|nr:ATP-binding cassette, subfamily bacterial HlyB/CyaB [Thermoleophilaceae bacterium]